MLVPRRSGNGPVVRPHGRRTAPAIGRFGTFSHASITAIRTFVVASLVCLLGLSPVVAAEVDSPSRRTETLPAERALAALRHAWLSELDDLTASARSLASARDTYEFVARPNLPYVHDNFGRRQLSAGRIDIALIVNRERSPLFWRRADGRPNRGFVDASALLAQLPALGRAGTRDGPSLAGAAQLPQGEALVVAMPITISPEKASRGWLILARELNAAQWHHYTEAAHVTADVVDRGEWPSDLQSALDRPLEPVFRTDDVHVLGFMAVPDYKGSSFRAFRVMFPLPPVARLEPKPSSARSAWSWLPLAAIVACVAGATVMILRRRNRPTGRAQRTPLLTYAPTVDMTDAASAGLILPAVAQSVPVTDSGAKSLPDQRATVSSRIPAGSIAVQRERRHAALAKIDTVIRYQPQVDLHTGRVAGVEALAFMRGAVDDRSSTTLVAQLEAAGLGLALAERRLQDICAERRLWRRQIGDDFPIGMPVSQLTLEDPGFLPLVWSTLAAYELPARFLELEVLEAVLDGGASSTRALAEASEAGALIAIDRYNGERSNLRALARFPVSKVRVDFALARDITDGTRMAKLFDGIVGAARGLGITVCATGIDSPELVTAAEYRGCRLAQGIALGLPSDGEQFLALVRGSGVDTANLPVLQIKEGQWLESDAAVA